MNSYQLIAQTIDQIVQKQVRTSNEVLMFHLFGIEEKVYIEYLEIIKSYNEKIGSRNLIVKTASPIKGYEQFSVSEDKTLTHYRNHLEPESVLIMIENTRISDGQSLQNIHPITEHEIIKNHLDIMIFNTVNALRKKVPSFEKKLPFNPQDILQDFFNIVNEIMPLQLKLTSAFLVNLVESTSLYSEKDLDWHIGNVLNSLQFFRDPDGILYRVNDQNKKLKVQLKRNREAVLIINSLPREAERKKWEQKINECSFLNTASFSNSQDDITKYQQVMREFFVNTSSDVLEEALKIDFRDVEVILGNKKLGKIQKIKEEIVSEISNIVADSEEVEMRLEKHKDVLQDMGENLKPSEEAISKLVDDIAPSISNKLLNKLTKLVSPPSEKITCTDFISGLYEALINIVEENLITEDSVISVSVHTTWKENRKQLDSSLYAKSMFDFLYGGMKGLCWEKIAWNWNVFEEDTSVYDDENKEDKIWIEVKSVLADGEEVQYIVIWQAPKQNTWISTTYRAAREIASSSEEGLSFVQFYIDEKNDPFKSHDDFLLKTIDWALFSNDSNVKEIRESNFPDFDVELKGCIVSEIEELAKEYTKIIKQALLQGMMSVSLDKVISLFSSLLNRIASIEGNNERDFYAKRIFYWLTIVNYRFSYVIFPLLHPLKWLWHQNRVRYWNKYLSYLIKIESESTAKSTLMVRPGREVVSSVGFPALTTSHSDEFTSKVAISIFEEDGYEIFKTVEEGNTESNEKLGKEEIHRIYDEYFSVYPFARDLLEVSVLYPTPNIAASICEATYDYIKGKSKVGKAYKVHLTFYVKNNGSLVYDVIEKFNNNLLEAENTLVPLFSARIETSDAKLKFFEGNGLSNEGIAIWVDVIQNLQFEPRKETIHPDLPTIKHDEYVKATHALILPFKAGNDFRKFELNEQQEPEVLQNYYRLAAALFNGMITDATHKVIWDARAALGPAKPLLRHLHQCCNWVCILDSHVDLQMIEQLFEKGNISIIHFMPFHQFNGKRHLTISSSTKAQSAIQRKVAQKLHRLLSKDNLALQKAAAAIIRETRRISSDALMKALGPNYFMNELIGVLATYQAHDQSVSKNMGEETFSFWLRLDDYKHWFIGKKRPDLAYVTINVDCENRQIFINIDLIEVKIVQDTVVNKEVEDAQRQLINGHEVLMTKWGEPSLASYQELYEAIIHHVQIRAGSKEEKLIEQWIPYLLLNQAGKISIQTKGYIYAFVHNSADEEIEPEVLKNLTVFPSIELPNDWYSAYLYTARGLQHLMQQYVEKMLGSEVEESALLEEESDDAELLAEVFKEINQKEKQEHTSETEDYRNRHEKEKEDELQKEKEAEKTSVLSNFRSEENPALNVRVAEQKLTTELVNGYTLNTNIYSILEEAVPYDIQQGEEHEEAVKIQDDVLNFYRKVGVAGLARGEVLVGPRVIRVKFSKPPSVTMKALAKYDEDLKLYLSASQIPLIKPGNDGMVWIDLARKHPRTVPLLESVESLPMQERDSFIDARFPLGVDLDGKWKYGDFSKNSSWLVGGSAGSGKSVFVRSLLTHLMLRNAPEELNLYIIDPKGDLFQMREAPHVKRIVTATESDIPNAALKILQELEGEMQERKRSMLINYGLNELKDVNKKEGKVVFPRTVLVIEEFNSLMMSAKEVQKQLIDYVTQIAQFGRAMGFHVMVCTQNPVVSVIPTELKANLNGRVALYVAQHNNSEVIIDEPGAEKLLKDGDLLAKIEGEPIRLQSPFISQEDIGKIIEQLKELYSEKIELQ